MSRTWTLPAGVFDAMAERAESDYPEETCGLVFGPDDRLEVVPMQNIQNKMHERDPENFPRDACRAYFFDPVLFHKTAEEKEAQGLSMRAIYHSHPDNEAYFSKKDKEDAAPADWGPMFPECIYIVFSVKKRQVAEVKGYVWEEEANDFVEVRIARGGP